MTSSTSCFIDVLSIRGRAGVKTKSVSSLIGCRPEVEEPEVPPVTCAGSNEGPNSRINTIGSSHFIDKHAFVGSDNVSTALKLSHWIYSSNPTLVLIARVVHQPVLYQYASRRQSVRSQSQREEVHHSSRVGRHMHNEYRNGNQLGNWLERVLYPQ